MERWINLRLLEDKAIFNATAAVYLKLLEWFSTEHKVTVLNCDRVEKLCEECGISRASFHRAMNDLKGAGIITYKGGSVRITQYDELQKQGKLPIMFKR